MAPKILSSPHVKFVLLCVHNFEIVAFHFSHRVDDIMKGFFEKVQKNLQIDRNRNGITIKNDQYRGGGKSLGGSKPGKLIHISLPNPGQIGVKVSVQFYRVITKKEGIPLAQMTHIPTSIYK